MITPALLVFISWGCRHDRYSLWLIYFCHASNHLSCF